MFFTIFLLFLAAVGYLVWHMRKVSSIRRQVLDVLTELEKTYREFVNQRLHLAVLEDQGLEQEAEKLQKDAIRLLQPLLMGLQDLIHSHPGLTLSLNGQGNEFKALYRLTAQTLQQASVNPEELVNRMNEHVQSSVEADLLQRITRLKTGKSLSA